MEANVFAGWIVRGIGGVATILERFAYDKAPMNKTHLAELGGHLERAVDAYNYLRLHPSLDVGDRPPDINFEGEPEGPPNDQRSEPVADRQTEAGADATGSQAPTALDGPAEFVSRVDRGLRWPFIEWLKSAANGITERWERFAYACWRKCCR